VAASIEIFYTVTLWTYTTIAACVLIGFFSRLLLPPQRRKRTAQCKITLQLILGKKLSFSNKLHWREQRRESEILKTYAGQIGNHHTSRASSVSQAVNSEYGNDYFNDSDLHQCSRFQARPKISSIHQIQLLLRPSNYSNHFRQFKTRLMKPSNNHFCLGFFRALVMAAQRKKTSDAQVHFEADGKLFLLKL